MTFLQHKSFYVCILIFCIHASCGEDENLLTEEYIPSAVEQYYLDVALNAEFGNSNPRIKKWEDNLSIFVDHNGETELLEELNRVIIEINSLSKSIRLDRVTNRTIANYFVFFGSEAAYKILQADAPTENSHGLSNVNFQTNSKAIFNGNIYGNMWVDVVSVTDLDCQKHILREELTQGLGLLNDSNDFPESIFYQDSSCTTEYSPTDIMILTYHLDPNIEANMNKSEVIEIFSKD